MSRSAGIHNTGVSVKPSKHPDGRLSTSKQADHEIRLSKRKAAEDLKSSSLKRRRIELTNFTVETQASHEITNKKQLSAVPSNRATKRKAADDGDSPAKKTKSGTTELPAVTTNSPKNSCSVVFNQVFVDQTYKDKTISQAFDGISPEEERLYQMASVVKTSKTHFKENYVQFERIGRGGFGSVYAGIRVNDFSSVAIKHILLKEVIIKEVMCNGNIFHVILEVVLMLKAAGLPGGVGKGPAVSLLDWYVFDDKLTLVMERPIVCQDLFNYLDNAGTLEENEAKMILKQLVAGAVHLKSRGVFHRDIKGENILLDFDYGVMQTRFIDFGCGNFWTDEPIKEFWGTFCPPEFYSLRSYQASPATVWQLGVLFYSLLHGLDSFPDDITIKKRIYIKPGLSSDSKTIIKMCLRKTPEKRATLEDLVRCLENQPSN